jgi:hypothetical protein
VFEYCLGFQSVDLILLLFRYFGRALLGDGLRAAVEAQLLGQCQSWHQ